MDIIKDIIYVNKKTVKNSFQSFKKSWYIIFTGIVYTILNLLIFNLVSSIFRGPLSILLGFILAIVSSSFISNYLYLLFNIVNYDRVTFQDFKDGFTALIWKIYGVFFISYIANLLLSLVIEPLGNEVGNINSLLYLLAFVILNALPETLYLKSYRPWDSIVSTFEFMKDNWLNWIIPNIVFLGLLYMITGNVVTDILNTHISINVFSLLSVKGIIMYIIGQSIFSFMMIYRGHMYKILSTSTRRKREFMNKF
ncbi:MAG TPA: hypothetical protein VK087_02980 [Tissierellaceae bacterium]|nr:hypothetical protein [Tissierellaceae bacterium]